MPTFSIIIPCYNQAHFLQDSLSGVLAQSFQDWEAIVVNDGSSDNTNQLASEWIAKDSRIKLFTQPNQGLSAARNAGIQVSTGKYIALLDADDKFGSEYLSQAVIHLDQGSDLVFCGYTYFNAGGSIHKQVSLSPHLDFSEILSRNLLPPVSVTFNKKVLDLTGNFDTSLKSAEDWDLWIRMYKCDVRLSVIPECLVYYRISADSMSRQAFMMYAALKKVAHRSLIADPRLSGCNNLSISGRYSLTENLKKSLMLCMGVAVIQGRIHDAVEFIRNEAEACNMTFVPEDFASMCSYLSFRYSVNDDDINWVFQTLMPQFDQFFIELNWPGLDKSKSLQYVFAIHRKIRNRKKWGIFSPLINQFSW